jgi:branched-chain amino acid aminotransferase
MRAKVMIAGRIVSGALARVSVFDRGFLFGDGLFEVLRTEAMEPLALDRHLARLARGAAALQLGLPPRRQLAADVRRTIAALKREARVKIIVTRGAGGLRTAWRGSRGNVIIIAEPLPTAAKRAVRLALSSVPPSGHASLKTLAYLDRLMALRQALAKRADDAVILDASGRIVECATANLFVKLAGQWTTPALTGEALPGVTRQLVIEASRRTRYPIQARSVLASELSRVTSAFVTSAVSGVVAVAKIADRTLHVGAEISEISDRFLAYRREI